jgi:hypothetical protein
MFPPFFLCNFSQKSTSTSTQEQMTFYKQTSTRNLKTMVVFAKILLGNILIFSFLKPSSSKWVVYVLFCPYVNQNHTWDNNLRVFSIMVNFSLVIDDLVGYFVKIIVEIEL